MFPLRRLLASTAFLIALPLWAGAEQAPEEAPMQNQPHDMMPGQMSMSGLLGEYPLTREASGTSWQPEATPMAGRHFTWEGWMAMVHGYINAVYANAGGPRGDADVFSESMFMMMGERAAGSGTLGVHAALSLDPLLIGKQGYPLLFQTGETADGRTSLIDRQHPHDLFMELSSSYSLPLPTGRSVFVYAGLPGEPALGPPAFMHRFSGSENPEAPLLHHWLDSTHIAFGVVTLGYINRDFKFEVSSFRGREPDENRYNIETGPLDSWSVRMSYNWGANWSMQGSFGHIHSPEQLEPKKDVDRTTFSIAYDQPLAQGNWQTTFAWGRNQSTQYATTSGFLLESTASLNERDTLFARVETAQKDELFSVGEPLAGQVFRINKVSVGYIRDFYFDRGCTLGAGIEGSKHFIPTELDDVYGVDPASFLLFLRAKL
jgi:hypothetical protein